MAAKPMSKSKIVSHIAEKCGTPKKTAVLFFEELFKLAVKEAKGAAGKFVIPNIGRVVKAHRKARGRSDQDQGQDRSSPAPGEGVQGRRPEVDSLLRRE
jgi:nucleoid DNA-binding protein